MADAVTYAYYTDTYCGTAIEESDWDGYEARSRARLSMFYAQFKLTAYDGDFDTAASNAICAMAEQMQNFDLIANGDGPIESASIGSVSVSNARALDTIDVSEAGQERALLKCVQLYFNVFAGLQW